MTILFSHYAASGGRFVIAKFCGKTHGRTDTLAFYSRLQVLIMRVIAGTWREGGGRGFKTVGDLIRVLRGEKIFIANIYKHTPVQTHV